MWLQHGIRMALLPSTACRGLHVRWPTLRQNLQVSFHLRGGGDWGRLSGHCRDKPTGPTSSLSFTISTICGGWRCHDRNAFFHLPCWKFHRCGGESAVWTVWVNGFGAEEVFYLAIPFSALLPCVCHHNIIQGDGVGVNTVNHVSGRCDVAFQRGF